MAREELERVIKKLEKDNCELKLKLQRSKQREEALIAKSKLLHQKFIRTERFAVTGRLTTAIAHEINSPLQAISFIIEALQKTPSRDEQFFERIELLRTTFENMRRTVRKMLDLSHPWDEERKNVNINRVLEDIIQLYRIQLKRSGVRLNLDLAPEVPDVIAMPHQLSHVFLNLLNNAHEAMTSLPKSDPNPAVDMSNHMINVKTSCGNKKVVIQVSDNGPGIPEKALKHIFDPFYTLKKGNGVGMGLSLCQDFIKKQGGTIMAGNSSPEGGAVFTVELPCIS